MPPHLQFSGSLPFGSLCLLLANTYDLLLPTGQCPPRERLISAPDALPALPSPLPRQSLTSRAADTSLGAATQLASSLLTPGLQSSALNLTVRLSECHLSQEKACRRMCVQVHNYTHVHSPKLSAQGGVVLTFESTVLLLDFPLSGIRTI